MENLWCDWKKKKQLRVTESLPQPLFRSFQSGSSMRKLTRFFRPYDQVRLGTKLSFSGYRDSKQMQKLVVTKVHFIEKYSLKTTKGLFYSLFFFYISFACCCFFCFFSFAFSFVTCCEEYIWVDPGREAKSYMKYNKANKLNKNAARAIFLTISTTFISHTREKGAKR